MLNFSFTNVFRMEVRARAAALLAAAVLGGCSTPQSRPATGGDHAYIDYWGSKGGGKLRLAVKDLIDMKGVVTTAGSEFLLKHSRPASRDAACLALARRRGVDIVGKTNLSEFAVRVSGMNEYFGTPINRMARRKILIPGGSSSGSAVAIQDGTADVAFGTDTAGSIRVPAACCGVFGLKTTFGLVPLKGVFPISPTHLDTIGPIAGDPEHLAMGMDLLEAGFRGQYEAAKAAHPSPGAITIGRLYIAGTDHRIDESIDRVLAARGFRIVVLDKAFNDAWKEADSNGARIAAAGAWFNGVKYGQENEVATVTKAVFTVGRIEYSLKNYHKALAALPAWRRTLRSVFAKVDFIALPTLSQFPPGLPPVGSALFESQVLRMQNTSAVNYAGNPAIAIPIPTGEPEAPLTSLQIIGRPRAEAALINVARLIEPDRPVVRSGLVNWVKTGNVQGAGSRVAR